MWAGSGLLWGTAEAFLPGTEERRIIVETAFVARLSGGHTAVDIFSGEQQPLRCDIRTDAATGFLLEGMHQIVFTHIELIGKGVCSDRLLQMRVDIFQTVKDLGV